MTTPNTTPTPGSTPDSIPGSTPGSTPAPNPLAKTPPGPASERPTVELHTDGACSGNPGPGGWAYILIHPSTSRRREASGAEHDTTNNKMELRAVIEGLSSLSRPSTVDLYSDSKYVLDGLREWMPNWKARNWRTAGKKPVKNRELWERLDALKSIHHIRFHWIKGHADHPENQRCDQLAVAAREQLVGP